MNNRRYLAFALAMTVVAMIFAFRVVVAAFCSAMPFRPHAAAVQQRRLDRRALESQLESMREMHRRMLSATSPWARHAMLQDSEFIMLDGLEMMLQMKIGKSTSSVGGLASGKAIETEAEGLKDLVLLMELLTEMEDDQESALRPLRARSEDMPMTHLIRSGAGTCTGNANPDA